MKGVELPINVLVLVAIAVIILLSIIALYFIGWSPFGGFISLSTLKNTGCSNFSFNYACGARNATTKDICLPSNSYLTKPCRPDGTDASNLFRLCFQYFNVSDDAGCREVCGCI